MGAVAITLNGVMFPKGKSADDEPVPCTIVGYAWRSDLAVDISPPTDQPHPEHPIVLPPAPPGEPSHPIVLPDPPPEIPDVPPDTSVVKPPPPEGGWGWSPAYGWGYFPGTGGPGPKKK
jgi:hypothetical protein